MATITHVIRSDYDPADREKLERETGQQNDDTPNDPWQTESSFSAQCRNIRAAPTFVPATIAYDEWGVPSHTPPLFSERRGPSDQSSNSTAEWYKSLRLTAASSSSPHAGVVLPPRPSSTPGPSSHRGDARTSAPRSSSPVHVTRKDWFIRRALHSEPSSKPSSPVPSLADLLARDPPPLPSEGRYVPPVWLHIGPSNKGFGMLERSGWREGEGLGAHVVRTTQRGIDDHASLSVRLGTVDIQTTHEVIDLTLSDSGASEDVLEDNANEDAVQSQIPAEEVVASRMQRSLLTPLPTILKADRLGIGLKAKTEGPYKQSKKRVTHNATALAAHIRSAEEMQRKKAVFGKGKRGFAKTHKREEDKRKSMLAYLNE